MQVNTELIYDRSETCMAVEMMFSMSYLFRFHGVNRFADKAERAAFNAFPAAITPDCKSGSSLPPCEVLTFSRVGTPIRPTDKPALVSELDGKAILQRRLLREHFRSRA